MELPIEVRAHAEELIRRFCEARVPEAGREEVRLLFKTKGCSITLIEERPHFQREGLWALLPIARSRYQKTTGQWTLYRRNRSLRWFVYPNVGPARDLSELIAAVDRDTTGIFWG